MEGQAVNGGYLSQGGAVQPVTQPNTNVVYTSDAYHGLLHPLSVFIILGNVSIQTTR